MSPFNIIGHIFSVGFVEENLSAKVPKHIFTIWRIVKVAGVRLRFRCFLCCAPLNMSR